MFVRPTRLAAAGMLALAALAAPLTAQPPSHIGGAIEDLQDAYGDFRQLRDSGQLEFSSDQAEMRYRRAMRLMRRAILDLDDGGGGGDPADNFRGRAVVALRQHLHSSYAAEAISKLPHFVSEDDLTFIAFAAQAMHGSYVAGTLAAFYTNPTSPRPGNKRGEAAKAAVTELHSSYVADVLRALPGYLSEDGAGFVAYLCDATHGSYVAGLMAAYTAQPPSPRQGNRKGSAARILTQALHSSYLADCLRALPGYVATHDLDYVRTLASGTHGSYVAARLREYFGERAAAE